METERVHLAAVLGLLLVLTLTTLGTPLQAAHADASGSQSCSASTSISSNFNGNSIAGGDYVWFVSVMDLKSPVPDSGLTINFTGQTIMSSDFSLNVPNSRITFSWSASSASTFFDASTNTWITTVPAGFGNDVFLSGLAYLVPPGGLPGGINPVTWTGTLSGSSAFTVQWKWGAAVYTQFSDYDSIGVKPVHSTSLDSYPNGDMAGTPENEKAYVIGGARGGGGSNWTGSWSSTNAASGTCYITPPPPACSSSTTVTLTVNTVAMNGSTILGYEINLYDCMGNAFADANSPATYTIDSGIQYTIVPDLWPNLYTGPCTFAFWQDTGSSLTTRNVTLTSDTTLTAVYNCGPPYTGSNLLVHTVDQAGNPIAGYYVALFDQGGNQVNAAFSPGTFQLRSGSTYSVSATGDAACAFSQWQDTGSANSTRTFAATDDTQTFTAVYVCA